MKMKVFILFAILLLITTMAQLIYKILWAVNAGMPLNDSSSYWLLLTIVAEIIAITLLIAKLNKTKT